MRNLFGSLNKARLKKCGMIVLWFVSSFALAQVLPEPDLGLQPTDSPSDVAPLQVFLSAEQFNGILYTIIFCAMCICGCIGATAHEGAAR